MSGRTLIQTLVLKYTSLKTLYEGGSEVRHYRNDLTGAEQVGKRIDMLGLEEAVALREAQLLQSIRHDNLVPVFDVAHVPGYDSAMKVIELIMPYFKRGSVCDALERGERFSVGQACLLAQAALRGLGELHEKHKILHRDLKSPNVFLADDDTLLKVGDLGVAVPMDPDGTAEAYHGVQIYTPPETFTLKRVDRRADLYAIGLLLVELLNGPLAYASYTDHDMRKRLEKGRPVPTPADVVLGPFVPPRLRMIVRKAMSAKPQDRFGSAAEMRDAIAKVPLIDWGPMVMDDDARVWEGASAQRRDRRFRVEARPRRNGRWSLSALQYVKRWQRFLPDQLVDQPVGAEATAFFDQVLSAALSR